MNSLVAYYSLTGNTKEVAEAISSQIGADVEQIQDLKERIGFFGYLRSSGESFMRRTAEICPIHKDPRQYDLVILGSPVWAWNLPPPIRSYIIAQGKNFQKFAFFCTLGGAGGDRVIKQMTALCGKEPIDTMIITEGEIKKGNYDEKLQAFIQVLSQS